LFLPSQQEVCWTTTLSKVKIKKKLKKDKNDKRNVGGKLMEKFIQNCVNIQQILHFPAFLVFLTLNDGKKFQEYVERHLIPVPSFYFSFRKIGKKSSLKFDTREITKHYKELKPGFVQCVNATGELVFHQIRWILFF
jgi:hypothetical protein